MIKDPKGANQRRQRLPNRISRNTFHHGREVMAEGAWSPGTYLRFHDLNSTTSQGPGSPTLVHGDILNANRNLLTALFQHRVIFHCLDIPQLFHLPPHRTILLPSSENQYCCSQQSVQVLLCVHLQRLWLNVAAWESLLKAVPFSTPRSKARVSSALGRSRSSNLPSFTERLATCPANTAAA